MKIHHNILLRSVYTIMGAILGALSFVVSFNLIPAWADFQIEERYYFTTDGAPSAALAVLLPTNGPYQRVDIASVTWEGEQSLSTHGDLQVLRLWGALQPGENIASIRYQVKIRQGQISWQMSSIPEYLQPQQNIESDSPEIQSLALQNQTNNARKTAYQQYLYASQALDWPTESRVNESSSALNALHTGIGGCNEYANLMVALNRTSGIPARVISGLAYPSAMLPWMSYSTTWSHPAGAHAWVEFYTEKGWEMADPSWANSLPVFLYFGRNDGSHLRYGEQAAEETLYQQEAAWVKSFGNMVAGMSAPLKFAAAASEEVTFTPSVTVRKTWDSRWTNTTLAMILVVLVIWLLDRFTKRYLPIRKEQ